MVVKPLDFVVRGPSGLVQPAIKVRGREYLRIIYGPEYTLPANFERLRERGVAAKWALAAREFALGVEGLERFRSGESMSALSRFWPWKPASRPAALGVHSVDT